MSEPIDPQGASAQDGLDPGVLEAHQRCLEVGAVVFEEGDPGRALYFIRSGEIELARGGASGAGCLARLGAGEFFGEQAVLLAGPRRARAVVTREAELLELDADVFEEMCLERPDITLRITRGLAARAQALEQRLAGLEGEDDLHAMVRVLVRLAETTGPETGVTGTLRTLAAEAGLGLLAAHHAFQQLVDRKLIRLADDVVVVPDLVALGAALEG